MKAQPRQDTPEKIYERLQQFWRMHAAGEDPDWTTLRRIHSALCAQEDRLRSSCTDQCIAHLNERLEDARRFGMELPIPAWAAEEIRELEWFEVPVKELP